MIQREEKVDLVLPATSNMITIPKTYEIDTLANIFENIMSNENFKWPEEGADKYGKCWEDMVKKIGKSIYRGLVDIKTIRETAYKAVNDLRFGDLVLQWAPNYRAYVDLKVSTSPGNYPGATIAVSSERGFRLDAYYVSISHDLSRGFIIKHSALRDMIENDLIYPDGNYYHSTSIVSNIHLYEEKGLAKILNFER